MERPQIVTYTSHHAFVADMFAWFKSIASVRSYRWAAKRVDMAPGHLSNVAKGTRSVPVDKIEAISGLFELSADEREVFRLLVARDRAGDPEAIQSIDDILAGKRAIHEASRATVSHADLVYTWYVAAVAECLRLPGARRDADWICTHLGPAVTLDQARHALALLDAAERRVGAEALRTVSTGFSAPEEEGREVHRQLIQRAANALETGAPESQRFESVTAAVSSETLTRLEELTRRFVANVVETCKRDEGRKTDVVQLNVHLFSLLGDRSTP